MYDIVVNCSGIGANQLVPDPSVVPVRGQIMRVSTRMSSHLTYAHTIDSARYSFITCYIRFLR